MNKRPEKATDLETLRRVCRPTPLEGPALDAFFVETGKGRDPHRLIRQCLETALEDERANVLLYGHRGSGKSTEINKFLAERAGLYLPVKFSVLEEMTPTNARADDLILVIGERLLKLAESEALDLDSQRLNEIQAWFADKTQVETSGRETSMEAAAGADSASSPLNALLGLFARFKAEIKFDSHNEETAVYKLRKRPGDLLDRINALLREAEFAVNKKFNGARRLLVVVEDLDKLDLRQARDIYVNNASLLAGLQVRALYTIPIYLLHSPEAAVFQSSFSACYSIPMITTMEPDKEQRGMARAPGFELVKLLVLRRIDEKLIAADALDHLVENTGGVLRHVFQVLDVVSTMVDVAPPIELRHIQYGLAQVRKELWQSIALPYDQVPGGPEDVGALYRRLAEFAIQCRNGTKPTCVSDFTNQILLKTCALVEYNGEGWFGVHPLVIPNLEKLGLLDGDGG